MKHSSIAEKLEMVVICCVHEITYIAEYLPLFIENEVNNCLSIYHISGQTQL